MAGRGGRVVRVGSGRGVFDARVVAGEVSAADGFAGHAIAVIIVGVGVLVWIAYATAYHRPTGYGLAALVPVGGVIAAFGMVGLGLAIAVPADLLLVSNVVSRVASRKQLLLKKLNDERKPPIEPQRAGITAERASVGLAVGNRATA